MPLLPKWMTCDVRDLFKQPATGTNGALDELKERVSDLKRSYQQEIESLKALAQRPRYVEMKPFEPDDVAAAAKLAKVAVMDEFRFFIESLRQDVYFAGIVNESDEKMVLNAAMKLKGIELVWKELNKYVDQVEEANNERR
jgi:hypothetical protein